MDPEWIPLNAAIRVHDYLVRTLGGLEGLPHPHYLESAIMAPQQHLHYTDGGADLFDLAAVYLYHIARGHAFVDGNKRTAYVTAMTFLAVNHVNIALSTNVNELAEATVEASKGLLGKAELAEIMRRMPRANAHVEPSGESAAPSVGKDPDTHPRSSGRGSKPSEPSS